MMGVMQIPDGVVEEATHRYYGDAPITKAYEVIVEWARRETLREAEAAIGRLSGCGWGRDSISKRYALEEIRGLRVTD